MDRRLLGIAILVLATVGCHACSDCCDYLPPVANGPYQSISGRAGSNSAQHETETTETALPEVSDPDGPITDGPITPVPAP